MALGALAGVPAPTRVEGGLAVAADIHSVKASVRFDVEHQVAEVVASVELTAGGTDGFPVLDLRQDIDAARLDGKALAPDALRHRDMGAGEDARMRVLDVSCSAGSRHELRLEYRLGRPAATGAVPVGWSDGGDAVTWDLWMSDLEPGRYLEMWLPANLCHDQMALELDVEVNGTARPHVLLANGAVAESSPGASWAVRYPATFTSLSPLLVVAPADQVRQCRSVAACAGRLIAVTTAAMPGSNDDLGQVSADACAWLSYFGARYGPWAHGDELLAVMWDAARGMEYDGATTASEPALEHEIFHSWFGRGVKPARASDGWVDEAMATWATASRRAGGARFAAEELGLDEQPAILCPPHPWSRHTPREAYTVGSRLLAGVAHMAGGAAPMRAALADWHRCMGGGAASTDDLARHLSRWAGCDLGPWWDRYVHGRDAS